MKTCARCTCEKAMTEFAKNRRRPDGLNAWCRGCQAVYDKAYNASRPGAAAARVKAWREANPDARKREYLNNAENVKRRAKAWLLANPAKRRLFWANYRAKRLNATPVWADKEFIGLLYAEVHDLNRRGTRGCFHVDHIVPLNSSLVCGLHTEQNLQVLPALENMGKSNRFWPDMA